MNKHDLGTQWTLKVNAGVGVPRLFHGKIASVRPCSSVDRAAASGAVEGSSSLPRGTFYLTPGRVPVLWEELPTREY